MCRHLAYLGPPKSLRELILDPPHSLYRQSWAPRRQRYGTVNADGFGVGWYAEGDPVPARYRRDIPVWNDLSLPDLARVTRSGTVLAAVRSATPGTAGGEAAAAPFGAGTWLFSHNGVLRNWEEFESRISVREIDVLTDSAVLWALTARLLKAGAAMDVALAAVIAEVEAAGGSGRFNFLLTDGRSVAATAAGDTLCYRQAGGGVTVASEPCDDEPGWTDVPDRHVVTVVPQPAGPGRPPGGPPGVSVRPLAAVLSTASAGAAAPPSTPDASAPDEGVAVR